MARVSIRRMPEWKPVEAVAVETGERVLAMQMPSAFSFHVPNVTAPGKVQRPARNPDGSLEVLMKDGAPVLDARGEPTPSGRTEEVDGDVVIGHGGMVGGKAGDYVVLWGGEFCSCTPFEVVPLAVIEAENARKAAEAEAAKAAAEAARLAEVARVEREAAEADQRAQEAAAARAEAEQIAAALPRADEVAPAAPASSYVDSPEHAERNRMAAAYKPPGGLWTVNPAAPAA